MITDADNTLYLNPIIISSYDETKNRIVRGGESAARIILKTMNMNGGGVSNSDKTNRSYGNNSRGNPMISKGELKREMIVVTVEPVKVIIILIHQPRTTTPPPRHHHLHLHLSKS